MRSALLVAVLRLSVRPSHSRIVSTIQTAKDIIKLFGLVAHYTFYFCEHTVDRCEFYVSSFVKIR